MPTPDQENRHVSIKEILFLPFGCLFQISGLTLFSIIGVIAIIFLWIFFGVNTDMGGIFAPVFTQLHYSSQDQIISADNGHSWQISFESDSPSIYSGIVRHITPDRETMMPFVTHDILVTTGDFADPDLVTTSIAFHHFFWRANSPDYPTGTINLIHAVVLDPTIYATLMLIDKWDTVQITGYEIGRINAYDSDGSPNGFWTDTGCNTLLITEVQIISSDH
jgi:hypothetical protein